MAELADAAHAAAEHGAETTAQEYITHHLSYLTFAQHPMDTGALLIRWKKPLRWASWRFTSIPYSGPCFLAAAPCCFSAGSAKSHL